jgi:hypothetical protein
MRTRLAAISRTVLAPTVRLHRDERGGALEYALVLVVFALPAYAVAKVLVRMLSDYYSMISFYVGWPFL